MSSTMLLQAYRVIIFGEDLARFGTEAVSLKSSTKVGLGDAFSNS